MKIIDLLDDRSILLDGRVADKKAALDQMVSLVVCVVVSLVTPAPSAEIEAEFDAAK